MAGLLVLVDGPSASGKSELQEHLKQLEGWFVVIRKFTTRTASDKAAAGAYADQITISDADCDDHVGRPGFIWYGFFGFRYGFKIEDVENKLGAASVFIIVRDLNVIARMKALGAARSFRVVAVLLTASRERREHHLRSKQFSEDEVQRRINRDRSAYPPQRQLSPLYDGVIRNDGDFSGLVAQFCAFVEQHGGKPKLAGALPSLSVPADHGR